MTPQPPWFYRLLEFSLLVIALDCCSVIILIECFFLFLPTFCTAFLSPELSQRHFCSLNLEPLTWETPAFTLPATADDALEGCPALENTIRCCTVDVRFKMLPWRKSHSLLVKNCCFAVEADPSYISKASVFDKLRMRLRKISVSYK